MASLLGPQQGCCFFGMCTMGTLSDVEEGGELVEQRVGNGDFSFLFCLSYLDLLT